MYWFASAEGIGTVQWRATLEPYRGLRSGCAVGAPGDVIARVVLAGAGGAASRTEATSASPVARRAVGAGAPTRGRAKIDGCIQLGWRHVLKDERQQEPRRPRFPHGLGTLNIRMYEYQMFSKPLEPLVLPYARLFDVLGI